MHFTMSIKQYITNTYSLKISSVFFLFVTFYNVKKKFHVVEKNYIAQLNCVKPAT